LEQVGYTQILKGYTDAVNQRYINPYTGDVDATGIFLLWRIVFAMDSCGSWSLYFYAGNSVGAE
jgi:hypothetical protein